MWNESRQLQRRYVSFNLNALIQIAEGAAGDDAVCANVTKLPERSSNKMLSVSMRDGKEVVVKISTPNAGMGEYGTALVVTMRYVSSRGYWIRILTNVCLRRQERNLIILFPESLLIVPGLTGVHWACSILLWRR